MKKSITHVETPRVLRFADFPRPAESGEPCQIITTKGSAPSPYAFARTPLFGASEKSRTVLMPDEELVVIDDPDGYQVVLCGGIKSNVPGPFGRKGEHVSSRFDQYDYTVFLGLLRYVGGRLGVNIVLEPYAFVKSLGVTAVRDNVRAMFESIARMSRTEVAVRQPIAGSPGEFEYLVGRLVSSVGYNSKTDKYSIMLDPNMAGLFRPAHFSSLVWQHRLAIKSALGKFLHAELTSHDSGRFRWVHQLQKAYGSNSDPAVFKNRLKKAAMEVAEVTGWTISFEKNASNANEKLVCTKGEHDEPEASDEAALAEVADAQDQEAQAAGRPRFSFTH